MTTSTKRIALIIAGALLSGAALMAQGAASPSATTKTPPAKVQAQGKTAKTARARRSHTAKKASHRHRRARKAAAVKPTAK